MRILKLHGDSGNTGGIVNFQNSLSSFNNQSKHEYIKFRTGKVQSSKILSQPFIRFCDQILSYLWYPLFLRLKKPDVVEINSSMVPGAFKRDLMYSFIARLTLPKARIILFNHGWDCRFYQSLDGNRLSKYLLRKYFSVFNDIIALTNNVKRKIIEYGYSGNLHVVTTGINVDRYINARHKIKDGNGNVLTVLFLSRIEKDKGVLEFVQAIPYVLEVIPEAKFIMAGSGGYISNVHDKVKQLNLSEFIEFPGYVREKEKLDVFSQADIFVLPSYSEGCPVSVLEAVAVGLPIIYTDVGALPDILANGINGLMIQQRSAKSLATAIIKLTNEPGIMEMMSSNNIKLSSEFDLKKIHKGLERIYEGNV